MRMSVRFRVGLLLAISLVTAVPSMTALASAPDESVPATGPLAFAADLLDSASNALNDLSATIDSTVSGVMPAAGVGAGSGSLDYGNDGRLTILLLGSDYRKRPYIGERMDIIIVATRKANGQVAVASIPRDTVHFPKAKGGTSGTSRVNTMYYSYKRTSRFGPTAVDCVALNKFKKDVAAALQTEIDYYAMVRMKPFVALVDNIGYVAVDVPGPIIDPVYGKKGIYFPNEDNYHLQGNDLCRAKPDRCHSALAYVRSRHGTQAGSSNNDFKRAYRQHDFIFDAIARVRSRGTGAALSELMEGIRGKVYTNVPKTSSVALQLYSLLGGISLAAKDKVVLGPLKFAYSNSSTPIYTFRMRLPEVRSWINTHFGS